jgi:hypothetical protein
VKAHAIAYHTNKSMAFALLARIHVSNELTLEIIVLGPRRNAKSLLTTCKKTSNSRNRYITVAIYKLVRTIILFNIVKTNALEYRTSYV